MGFFPSEQGGPDLDKLILGTLRSPMLNELMRSMQMRAEVLAVANEIKARHTAKVPTHTGKLKSTAQVTSHRSTIFRDRRWEAEYSIGGPAAPYILPLEEELHMLADTLAEMGYRI